MKTIFPFSAMKKSIMIPVAAMFLFAAMLCSSENSVACTANFTVTDSIQLVYFTNQSIASNTAYWTWTFGDGSSSDLKNPVHVYNSYGPFLVCLTVHDTANNCTDTHCDSVYINYGGYCQALFSYSSNGLTADFTNLSSGNYTSIVWSFGDNTISYLNDPSHTYLTGGYYNVCVTVSDTGGNCSDTYCNYVWVNDTAQACNATFSYTANGTNIHFTNSSTSCNSASWYWSFGDGSMSSNFDPWHQYNASGYYTVCLSMWDSSCNCSDSVCETIFAGNNNYGCSSDFVLYPDSTQQGLYWGYNYSTGSNLVYYWWWGDGSFSTEQFPTHTYADSGYYTICLSIYDTITACSDSFCSDYYIMKQEKMDQIHEVIFVNTTGVPHVNPAQEIHWNIFPNPASDNISIETNADKIDEIRITDVNGRVVKKILNYNGGKIELKSLSQQVYIVQSLIRGTWSSKLLIRQ